MTTQKPDIIIIMADQLRHDCIGAAGHPTVQTPNLDRLCAEGTRFNQCYTTSPVCMPARSTFASGVFNHNHGQWYNYGALTEDTPTYMSALQQVGYHTAHIGKSHLYPHQKDHLDDMKPFMNTLGFQDVLEVTGPWATVHANSIMTDDWAEKGLLDMFREDYRKRQKAGRANATWPSPMPDGDCLDDFIGKTAVEYIESYKHKNPLCAFIGFGGPHEPWDPSERWAKEYQDITTPSPLPESSAPDHMDDAAKKYHKAIHNINLSPEGVRKIRQLYYAKVSQVDHWVGSVLDALHKRGNMDNTLILFWSDHGERLGDRNGLFKQVFYDESARVPFIVRRPDGKTSGQTCNALCSTADMTATICEVAGVDTVGFGKSVLPSTENPDNRINNYVFSEIDYADFRATMIRDKQYKMVVDSDSNILQLFDMKNDPQEMKNLAGDKTNDETVNRLRMALLQWRLKTDVCCK